MSFEPDKEGDQQLIVGAVLSAAFLKAVELCQGLPTTVLSNLQEHKMYQKHLTTLRILLLLVLVVVLSPLLLQMLVPFFITIQLILLLLSRYYCYYYSFHVLACFVMSRRRVVFRNVRCVHVFRVFVLSAYILITTTLNFSCYYFIVFYYYFYYNRSIVTITLTLALTLTPITIVLDLIWLLSVLLQ